MNYRRILIIGIFLLAGGLLLHLPIPARSQSDNAPWTSYIAYSTMHWTGTMEIQMINVVTGQPHILTSGTEDSIQPFWSPDGIQLAFTRYAQIYLLENAGKSASLREITGAYSDTNIAWRPDSSGFATSMGLTDLASGESQGWEMIPHPGYNLAWSPDGQVLLFDPPIMDARDEQNQWMDMATGETHATFKAEGITNTCCGIWSPDGTEIALLITTEGVDQLIVIKPGEADYRILTNLERPEMGTSFPLAWSPDGLHIAYVTAPGLLYVVNLRDFPNPRLVAQHVSYDRYGLQKFDWSPDGTQIAYINSNKNIFLVQADGTGEHSLVNDWAVSSLDWQPAQLHAGGQARIAVLDEEGLKMRSAPDVSGDIVSHLPNGTVVEVLEGPESGGGYRWWHLRTTEGQEGWSVQSADGIVTLLPRPADFPNLIYTGEPTPDPLLPLFGTSTVQPSEPVVLATMTVAGMSCVVTIMEDSYLYARPGGDENRAAAYLPAGSVVIVNGKAVSGDQTWWRWKDDNWLPETVLSLTDGCANLPLVEF